MPGADFEQQVHHAMDSMQAANKHFWSTCGGASYASRRNARVAFMSFYQRVEDSESAGGA